MTNHTVSIGINYIPLTKQNKAAQTNFEKKLAENIKKNSNSFYAYTRTKQRTKDKVGPLKDQNGELIVDDQKKAEII